MDSDLHPRPVNRWELSNSPIHSQRDRPRLKLIFLRKSVLQAWVVRDGFPPETFLRCLRSHFLYDSIAPESANSARPRFGRRSASSPESVQHWIPVSRPAAQWTTARL